MKLSRRLVALLICVLMVATALPMGIFAEETAVAQSTEHVKFCGVQKGVDGNSVRIIFGVDSLEYSKAGLKIERLSGGKGWIVGDMELTKTHEVFTSILADGDPVLAGTFGVEYLAMVAITDIDSEGAVRLTPYVKIVDGEEIYGESRIYAVDFVNGELELTMSTTSFTQDFTEFKPGAAGRDTWEQQSQPSSDNSWGGEGARTMAHDAENGYAVWVGGPMAYYRSATKPESRVSDKASALTFEDGTPLPYWTMSERLKFTKTIPYDLTPYLGQTIVITARIRVDEIAKYASDKEGPSVTVYVDSKGNAVAEGTEGAKAATYYNYKEEVMTGADAKVAVTFGFYDEFDTSPIEGASTTYELKADGEWVEISSSMAITQKLIDSLEPVKDANGVYHPSAVRPCICAGNSGAYIKTAYFDYVTCTIVPTVHDKCTDFVDKTIEGTCTVTGYVGKACIVCNKFDEATLVVTPAEGHKPNVVSDPCTQDTFCTVCGELLDKAEGHTNVEYLAPTISSDGYIKGTCGKCGEVFDEFLARGLYEDFENLDGFKFNDAAWNSMSGFATDDVEINSSSLSGLSSLVTEENGNTYWKKATGSSNGMYIYDTTEDKIFVDSIVEISFDRMYISGSASCSIIGFQYAGQTGTSDQRFLCHWSKAIREGADGGANLLTPKAGEWVNIRLVIDTTNYDHKVWLNGELVVETDYANNKIYYKTNGTWNEMKATDITSKNPYGVQSKDFQNFYLFHFNTNIAWGLDNFRIAILDSMPTDTRPVQ